MKIYRSRYYYGFAPAVRRWNKTAEDCYRIGCDCQKCPIYELFFKDREDGRKCHMKEAVMEMVRKFGIPDNLKRNDTEILKEK